MALEYSNLRRRADIEGWPYGSLRTTAIFEVESNTRGQRVTRTTINPKTGQPAAAKATTYAPRAAIADGSDGRTYIVQLSIYGSISVMRGDMKFSEESIHRSDPRFAGLFAALTDVK